MKTVLLLLCMSASFVVTAQPSHWRYGLYLGQAKPFTNLATAQPIDNEQLSIYSPASVNVQATIERSIRPNLSLRAAIGTLPIPYSFNSQYVFRDTTGRILGQFGASARSTGNTLTTGKLGITLNSRTLGRTILTAGVDGVVRINGRADSGGQKTGGRSNTAVTYQGQTQTREAVYEFITQQVLPVTFGVAARAGLDYRASRRGLISLEISYTKGLGFIRNAVSTEIRINGVSNDGNYSSRGSNVAVQVGYKHSLFRVNPVGSLPFTPYNQPELEPRRFLTPEQRLSTFAAKSWLYEVRAGYQPKNNAAGWGTGGAAAYFIANRFLVGLSADYQQYYDYSPFALGRLFQAGPFVRAYAGRGRVVPYVEGGYQLGMVSGPVLPIQFIGSIPVAAGFSIRVNESVRTTISYAVRYFRQNGRAGTGPSMPQLSFTYSPKRKSYRQS